MLQVQKGWNKVNKINEYFNIILQYLSWKALKSHEYVGMQHILAAFYTELNQDGSKQGLRFPMSEIERQTEKILITIYILISDKYNYTYNSLILLTEGDEKFSF